ncbi:hypothetical protein PUN28_002140 [Cardiocondyla obscurior]|uniref:Uncharacterized protein n=1 Tax=Cardiocondyla obscurior TaxID=286306 RepID=A0AAW2GSN8_9HYME
MRGFVFEMASTADNPQVVMQASQRKNKSALLSNQVDNLFRNKGELTTECYRAIFLDLGQNKFFMKVEIGASSGEHRCSQPPAVIDLL